MLLLQQIADFGQQLLLRRSGRCSRLFLDRSLPFESHDGAHQQEDAESNDEEVEHRLDEVAIVDGHGRLPFDESRELDF